MKVLILTVGPQGSGKSYTIKKTNLEHYSVSSDNLRILYSGVFPDGCHGAIDIVPFLVMIFLILSLIVVYPSVIVIIVISFIFLFKNIITRILLFLY